jgi:hypothetical protein
MSTASHLARISIAFLLVFLLSPAPARSEPPTVLTDAELASINAKGFYFRMDLSLEVFTDSATAPQVVLNTGTPLIIPTDTTGSLTTPSSSISLAGSAQSNLSALVNVIGASSVINVGVNIVNIANSTNDTIYTTNINTGAQGANFTISSSPPLAP